MKVNQFRFLTTSDEFDSSFQNWSRCYEWNYVLKQIESSEDIHTVLNSCCGTMEIHKQFADVLGTIPNKTILHTDIFTPTVPIEPFLKWNMCQPSELRFDCVLCISTLEELKNSKSEMINALNNLYNMCKKRLIVTFDYPDVPLDIIEKWVGEKCKKEGDILNGSNSSYRNDTYKHLNIVLLDISK